LAIRKVGKGVPPPLLIPEDTIPCREAKLEEIRTAIIKTGGSSFEKGYDKI
jgi:hypothetical protein